MDDDVTAKEKKRLVSNAWQFKASNFNLCHLVNQYSRKNNNIVNKASLFFSFSVINTPKYFKLQSEFLNTFLDTICTITFFGAINFIALRLFSYLAKEWQWILKTITNGRLSWSWNCFTVNFPKCKSFSLFVFFPTHIVYVHSNNVNLTTSVLHKIELWAGIHADSKMGWAIKLMTNI